MDMTMAVGNAVGVHISMVVVMIVMVLVVMICHGISSFIILLHYIPFSAVMQAHWGDIFAKCFDYRWLVCYNDLLEA